MVVFVLMNLHSTVVLLKASTATAPPNRPSHLHSTVVLLKVSPHSLLPRYLQNLHSTVVLLKELV